MIGLRKGLRGHATGIIRPALNLFAFTCKCLAKTTILFLNATRKFVFKDSDFDRRLDRTFKTLRIYEFRKTFDIQDQDQIKSVVNGNNEINAKLSKRCIRKIFKKSHFWIIMRPSIAFISSVRGQVLMASTLWSYFRRYFCCEW